METNTVWEYEVQCKKGKYFVLQYKRIRDMGYGEFNTLF